MLVQRQQVPEGFPCSQTQLALLARVFPLSLHNFSNRGLLDFLTWWLSFKKESPSVQGLIKSVGVRSSVFIWPSQSVQFSRSVVSNSLQPHEPQHARPPCPSPTPGVYSNPCPSSQWCHPTISSSVVPFSSHFNLSQHLGLFIWPKQATKTSPESMCKEFTSGYGYYYYTSRKLHRGAFSSAVKWPQRNMTQILELYEGYSWCKTSRMHYLPVIIHFIFF